MLSERLLHVRNVLDRISYKDYWYLDLEIANGRSIHLRVIFYARDAVTFVQAQQKGRDWIVSDSMSDSEIVSTAFKAILTAEEHEAREQFLYRGEPVFGPHQDVEKLASLLASSRIADRKYSPAASIVDLM